MHEFFVSAKKRHMKCHWSKASYITVADFQKGKEVCIYHVKKDLEDNPDCHTQSIRREGGGGR